MANSSSPVGLVPLVVTKPSDLEIRITRSFAARPAQVFDAFTRPELVTRWLGDDRWPMVRCEIDLRAGGRSRYEWGKDEHRMGLTATFVNVEAPRRTVHREVFDEDWTGGETTVTTVFEQRGDETEVVMTIAYSSRGARDAVLETPMVDGMNAAYDRLAKLLDSSPDPTAH